MLRGLSGKIISINLTDVTGAMVIFGAGYGFENLASVEWLRDSFIHYWGDIDTQGFAFINQLRGFFPQVTPFLMDHETLMEDQALWSVEPSPETGALIRLTAEESAFYDQLRQNELVRQIRMEQEKIGFKWVRFVKNNLDGICKLTIIYCFFE